MKKIIMLLSVILLVVACEKGSSKTGEAKVVVTVFDEKGKIVTDIPVKMYNEKDYEAFKKNNLAAPTEMTTTDSKGLATFTLPQEIWFATQKQRFLTFVVQEGGGPNNYEIWSSGTTVEAGKIVKVEIRLTQYPSSLF